MFLFSDMDAAIWLLVDTVIAVLLAYMVFFWLYHGLCGLDPSRAIRMALTVSLVGMLYYLCTLSPVEAPYMTFWSDLSLLPNFLIVAVPVAILLALAWASLPKELAR